MQGTPSSKIEQCTVSQLRTLLSIAAEQPDEAEALTGVVSSRAELVAALTDLGEQTADSAEVLLSTVCDAETPPEVLRGIKDLAKSLLSTARTDRHRATATFLYHLAVAAALAHHGESISTRPPKSRAAVYGDLAIALGQDPLGELFRNAIQRIEREKS